jgi:CheY-like chemotaxis protein
MSMELQQERKRRSFSDGAIRVLIVEDERDTLMTLGILLRSEGYEVHLEPGSAQVAAAVRDFRPHAVLLDIGMPGRDGYEVARELMATLGVSCPILIAVTAYGTAADKARAALSGFDHHVTKPYDPDQLFRLLETLRA